MDNVDHKEIAKFSALSNSWWDPNGDSKLLHDLNPTRLAWVTQHINVNEKKILDVGCGGGILAESMARLGAKVKGIDLAKKTLNIAKLHSLESLLTIDYEETSAEDLAKKEKEQYDAITCMEMLEHVPHPSSIVHACAELVKPQGYVFFSTINRTLQAYLLAIIGAEYLCRLLKRGTHDYAKFIQPAELASYARTAGLEIKQITGIHYNPLTQQFTLNQHPRVNYFMVCKKI